MDGLWGRPSRVLVSLCVALTTNSSALFLGRRLSWVTAWHSTQLLLLWHHSPSPDHFPRGPSYSSCSSSKATPIFGSSPLLQVLPIYFPSFRDFSCSSPQEIASILSYFPALLETLSITGMNGRQEHGLSLP